VRTRGKQGGDDRASRLVVGQAPLDLPVLVEPDRVRGVNDDLVLEKARILRDQVLDRAEPQGEDDGAAPAIASSTEAARAPSSSASACARDWSFAARTTTSPWLTRCWASALPMLPTPIIAMVNLTPFKLLAVAGNADW